MFKDLWSCKRYILEGWLFAIILVALGGATFILSSCGGGGGGAAGGGAVIDTTGKVVVTSGARKVGEKTFISNEVTVVAGTSFEYRADINNGTGAIITGATGSVIFPIGLNPVGNIKAMYKADDGKDTPKNLDAAITSTSGAPLGVVVPPGKDYVYVASTVKASDEVGDREIVTTILGKTTRLMVHVVESSNGGSSCTHSGTTYSDGSTRTTNGCVYTCNNGTWSDPVCPNNNHPPIINSASADKTSANTGATVNFTSSATDADGDSLSYSWVFGDGPTVGSSVANPSHQYTTAGTFTATVTVTDGKSGSTTANVTITVSGSSTPANIEVTILAYENGQAIRFSTDCIRGGMNDCQEAPYTWKNLPEGDYWAECGAWAGHSVVASHTATSKLHVATGDKKQMTCTYTDVIADGPKDPGVPNSASPSSGGSNGDPTGTAGFNQPNSRLIIQ